MSCTFPNTTAKATVLFQRMRQTIEENDHECKWIFNSLFQWKRHTSFIASSSITNRSAANVNQCGDTLLGKMIYLSCFPIHDKRTPSTHPKLSKTINRYSEQLCSIFTALMADPNTRPDLLDWFQACIRECQDNIVRIQAASNDEDVAKYAYDEFHFGLANLLMRLCNDAFTKCGDISGEYPAALLLHQKGSPSKDSFRKTVDLCQASGLPHPELLARAIHLFYLAHDAFKISYLQSWPDYERNIDCEPEPLTDPWLNESRLLLRFYHTTTRCLSVISLKLVKEDDNWLPRLPAANFKFQISFDLFSNVRMYCLYLRVFAVSSDTNDQELLALIAQSLVILVLDDHSFWVEIRTKMLDGLMMLVPMDPPWPNVAPINVYATFAVLPQISSGNHLLIVPALLRMLRASRQQSEEELGDRLYISSLFEILMHMFRVPEQLALIRNDCKLNRRVSYTEYDWRQFVFDLLDRINVLVAKLFKTKRKKKASAAAAVKSKVAFCENTFRLMKDHVRLLAAFIRHTPEMCYERKMAKQIAGLLNGMLHYWMATAAIRIHMSTDSYWPDAMAVLGGMFLGMAKCEVFANLTAQTQRLLNIWRLSDLACHREQAVCAELQRLSPRTARNTFDLQLHRAKLVAALRVRCELLALERAMANRKMELTAFDAPPDEFQDAISAGVMLQPVRLPASQMVLDMSTIGRHLHAKQNDPFTQTPLRRNQLQPDTELRGRIDKWKLSKKLELQRFLQYALAGCLDANWVPSPTVQYAVPPDTVASQVSEYLDVAARC